jgi:hypothetical protein
LTIYYLTCTQTGPHIGIQGGTQIGGGGGIGGASGGEGGITGIGGIDGGNIQCIVHAG